MVSLLFVNIFFSNFWFMVSPSLLLRDAKGSNLAGLVFFLTSHF